MIFRFTHLSGANANHIDTVEATPITLGRDQMCQVRFDMQKDLAVSAKHAEIQEVSEGTYQIANLSKNGIVVNGVPCDATAKLPNHATIQLGKDGPRIRFDVDHNVGGISKADVQKKVNTQKIKRGDVMREKAPTTEERPVFQVKDLETPAPEKDNRILLIVGGVAALLVLALLVFFAVR